MAIVTFMAGVAYDLKIEVKEDEFVFRRIERKC